MNARELESSDWSYPAEDDVGETYLHLLIRTLLLHLAQRHLASRETKAFVGSDQFVYWAQGYPHKAIAPDLFVVFGEEPNRPVRVWKTWEEGVVPSLAVEIVSENVRKDYVHGPMQYANLGVQELIIFDPQPGWGRVRWQVYRRDANAELVLVEKTDADRVRSDQLDCHLRQVVDAHDGLLRVRLATGDTGEDLVPTAEEAERTRRVELEAEVAALRRQLAARED